MSHEDIEMFFNSIQNRWESIDFLVHAIAFSDKNELSGHTITQQKKILLKQCSYLVFLYRIVKKLKNYDCGSIITQTFDGANRYAKL